MKHLHIPVASLIALSVLPSLASVSSRSVCAGETFTIVAQSTRYTFYRLVLKRIADKVAWEPDGSMANGSHKWVRIREIELYDHEGRVLSRGLSQTTNALADMPNGSFRLEGHIGTGTEDATVLFDGSNAELSCWFNPNPLPSYASSWATISMKLSSDAPAVASYNISAPNLEYQPGAWSFEASVDGETWQVLDSRSEAETLSQRTDLALDGWYDNGRAYAVWNSGANPQVSHFHVERGANLQVSEDAQLAGVTTSGGTVTIAPGATATFDVAAGLADRFVGGGLTGVGTVRKTGNGTLTVSGINSSFGGTVKVDAGTLRFAPLKTLPKYELYRFVAKKKSSAERLRLAEIALYDVAGNRINDGLSFVSYVTATNRTGTMMDMAYGQCTRQGQSTMYDSDERIYDGNLETGWNGWVQPSEASWAWLYFGMRPRKTAAIPVSYNLASSIENDPITWALQGSCDGVYWDELDEVNETRRSEIFPSTTKTWYNGGVPMVLKNSLTEKANGPAAETDARYFRFKVKAWGTTGSGGTRAIAELALYSIDGRRVNCGLVNKGRDAASLEPGSFTFHNKSWTPTYNGDATHEEKMFDNDLTTRLSGWSYGECQTDADCPYWTMRLKDDVPPVAAYNFAPYIPSNANTYPIAWTLEASKDGSSWIVVDSRTAEESASLLPPVGTTVATWCNGDCPIGLTQNCERGLVPTGAMLEVAKGARLELPSRGKTTISSLGVDLAATGDGAGTIVNLTAGSDGDLYVRHERRRPLLRDVELPLRFEGLTDGSNILQWRIHMNGVEDNAYRISFANGKYFLNGGPGFFVIVR